MTPPRTRILKKPCPELRATSLNDSSKAAIAKLSDQTKKDIAEHGLPFPLLADPTHETAANYGVLSKLNLPNGTSLVIASRDTYLIDPNGKVAKHYDVTPDKLEGHSKEVLTDIENFKAAKKG